MTVCCLTGHSGEEATMEYDSRGRARKLGSLNDLQMVDKLIVLSHNSLLLRNESTHEAFKVCVCVCVCRGGL